MKRFLFTGMILLAFGEIAPTAKSAERTHDYAFVDVSVIPMQTEGVLDNRTVIVKDDRIVEIGPADAVDVEPELTVIEGKGRFLMPGLADMHVHVWDDLEVPLYVANGITLVRNMWGERHTLAMRERIMSGKVVGPTIVTAGPLIDGEPRIWGSSARAVTPTEGRELVAEHKAAGFDFIKVYSNLEPEVFDAIAAAAKSLRIPFAGHVPRAVPLEHALKSGLASIEHTTGFLEATLVDGVSIGEHSRSPEAIALARRLAAGEVAWDEVFDAEEKLEAVAELARRTGVWNTPTLLVLKNAALTRDEVKESMAREEMQYVSPSMQMSWNRTVRSDADQKALKAFAVEAPRHRVAALDRAGAPLLAGTDAPNPHIVHGFAIHQELTLLHEAGLTRFEVLATATVNPAVFLGTPGEFGSVTEGARADLLLLEANPLEDLDNLKLRAGVMLRGRWLPEAELQAMLEAVAGHYRTAPDWFTETPPLPVPRGAEVRKRLQFVSTFADKPMTSAWLAVIAAPDNGRRIVAQSMTTGRNAGARSFTLDLNDQGALVRYSFDEPYQFGQEGRLERDGKNYRLTVADKADRENGIDTQTVTVGADDVVLTGTIADGFILADRLRQISIGDTEALKIWRIISPRGGLRLASQDWTIRRLPDAAKTGTSPHASEAARFAIEIRAWGPPQSETLWLAQDGSPLRLERSGGLYVLRRIE